MRVLVVGAGGMIGIPLCEELQKRGHWVFPLDRFFFGKKPSNAGSMAHPFKLDIRSIEPMLFSMHHRDDGPFTFDAVIDLAGLSNDASADIDEALTRDINLHGACRLATMAKEAGINRYIYSSSASVYGSGGPDLTEDAELKPLTLYAKCKAQVEDHIRKLDGAGFETVILRNATVFGVSPRMRFDLVLNIMAMTAWRDHEITVRGGDQWRPLVHVKDVVEAFVKSLTEPVAGKTINVGHVNMTMNQLARTVSAAAPWAKIRRVVEAVDHRDYHVSFALYNELLPNVWAVNPFQGAAEVISALRTEEVSADDPTCYTLRWYKSLIEWEKRLNDIRLDGRIL